MPTTDKTAIVPGRYFISLSQKILKKIDANKYRYGALPDGIQTMIMDDFNKFSTFFFAQQLEFISAVSKLQELPDGIEELVSEFSALKAIEKDTLEKILKYAPLSDKGQSSLALSNKGLYAKTQPQRLVSALLWHVASGNQETAQEMLEKYPNLLLERGTVSDYSGRKFENITAFEYALWALDVGYMCPMMRDCLPQNEEGEQIRVALFEQYEHLEKEGLTYTLNGKTISNEKHYDISPLTSALKTYVDNYHRWTAAQRQQHWCTVVGGEQLKTVAHVAQHYCEQGKPFVPQPSFNDKTFNRSLDFHNYVTNKPEKWWARGLGVSTAGLGSSCGVVKGGRPSRGLEAAHLRGGRSHLSGAGEDLAALSALWKVRIEEDLPRLKQRLQKPDSVPGSGWPCAIV